MSPSKPSTRRQRRKEEIGAVEPPQLQKFEIVRLRTVHSPNFLRFTTAQSRKGSLDIVVVARKGHVVIFPISVETTGDPAGSRGDSFVYKAKLESKEGIEVTGYVEGDSGWIELPHIPSDRRNLRF